MHAVTMRSWVSLAVLSVAMSCGGSREPPPVDAVQRASTGATAVDSGFYIGVAADTIGVDRDTTAWLFWLDRTTRRGRLYRPYGPISLCDVRIDSAVVQFSTVRDVGWRYAFTGRPTREGFAGRLDKLWATDGRLRDSVAIVFRRIPVLLTSPLNGLYRNVRATGEHLYGLDLLLLDGVAEQVGIVVEYEGTPNAPRLVPVSRVRDSVLISWASDHPAPDWARIERDGLLFGADNKMKRASDLAALLVDRGTEPARCP